jgi:hypothetical protein
MSLLRLRRLTTLPEASSLESRTSENSRFDFEAIAVNMRKQIITRKLHTSPPLDREWLNLQTLASVEVTSEDEAFPIESALLPEKKRGWRAAEPGSQTVRLIFDQPQKVRHISLEFEENETQRTQEFSLRWSPDHGNSYREIVRQQWNFSSPHATREVEDYSVELSGVTVIDLTIEPDKDNYNARASLSSLRLA